MFVESRGGEYFLVKRPFRAPYDTSVYPWLQRLVVVAYGEGRASLNTGDKLIALPSAPNASDIRYFSPSPATTLLHGWPFMPLFMISPEDLGNLEPVGPFGYGGDRE